MKRLICIFGLGLALAGVAQGDTSSSYVNNYNIIAPPQAYPQVDATNFQNNAVFDIATFGALFDFSNVQNFTNRNSMFGSPGFHFDTAPSASGARRPAARFVNGNLTGTPNTNTIVYGASQLLVEATNIINRGLLQVGSGGLLRLTGVNVDISRGVVQGLGFQPTDGFIANYWANQNDNPTGIMTSTNFDLTSLASAPYRAVTVSYQTNGVKQNWPLFAITNTTSGILASNYVYESGTNKTVQAVIVVNRNRDGYLSTNIQIRIVSTGGDARNLGTPLVEWAIPGTNVLGVPFTNYLILQDTFTASTNHSLVPQSPPLYGSTFGQLKSKPANYTLFRTNSPLDSPFVNPLGQPTSYDVDNFRGPFGGGNFVTNYQSTAFGVILREISQQPAYPQTIYTLPGRVEIFANGTNGVLNLNNTRIESENYLRIEATNHFAGNTNCSISSPYVDISLASTNGELMVSQFVNTTVPRVIGNIDIYTVSWTHPQVFTNGSTNLVQFNVLLVDSRLENTFASELLNLKLRSTTNVTIGQSFDITGDFSVDADGLTINPGVTLNLSSLNFDWASQSPYLLNFTNHGTLNNTNGGYGGGSFISHNRITGAERPYRSIVNTATGIIVDEGNVFNTAYFENFGSISSSNGPVFIQASDALLGDFGLLEADYADISITANNLEVSNHGIIAGRALTLAVTNSLNSGINSWTAGDGFNLLVKPATGDLLDTDVTCTAFNYASVINTWAGLDLGLSFDGFTDNAALFNLILTGGASSEFQFTGAGAANALYVVYLDFNDFMANLDADGNVAALVIDANMKIYYQSAYLNGSDMSAALDGKNNGRLIWLNGAPRPANARGALTHRGSVKSKSFTAKAVAAAGFAGEDVALAISAGSSADLVNVSWNTPANATSKIYVKPLGAGDWSVLTTYVSGNLGGRVSLQDGTTPSGLLYKVQIIPGAQ